MCPCKSVLLSIFSSEITRQKNWAYSITTKRQTNWTCSKQQIWIQLLKKSTQQATIMKIWTAIYHVEKWHETDARVLKPSNEIQPYSKLPKRLALLSSNSKTVLVWKQWSIQGHGGTMQPRLHNQLHWRHFFSPKVACNDRADIGSSDIFCKASKLVDQP